MNRQSISSFFRALGLAWVFDYARYQADRWKRSASNRRFKREHPDFVLPPDYMMYESFQMHYGKYYATGREDAEWIITHVKPYTRLQDASILEWGCGPARILRHMPALLGPSNTYTGTDYNPHTVDWCKQHIPGIRFTLNQLNPPLPFDGDAFDMCYAISVFTHLSAQSQVDWSSELHRVLKSNGVLFATTLGDAFLEIMTASEKAQYQTGAFVSRGNVKEGHRMYAAFHPPAFIKNVFEKAGFTVLEHAPGKRVREDYISQDVWVLRKG